MTRIVAGGITHPGQVRPDNQDAFGDFDPENGARRFGRLGVIADGVGGHRGGGVASQLAVSWVAETYYAEAIPLLSPDADDAALGERLRFSLREANRRVYDRARLDSSVSGMASTCTAMVIHRGRAHIAHIGDSRAYLVRDGSIVRLTRDHSLVQDRIDAGLLTEEQARTDAERNIITRSLGFEPDVEPDLLQPPVQLKAGDHLVLTTDGLHGLVRDEVIARAATGSEPMEACRDLVAAANAQGGPDNITVQIFRIEEI